LGAVAKESQTTLSARRRALSSAAAKRERALPTLAASAGASNRRSLARQPQSETSDNREVIVATSVAIFRLCERTIHV
jgi:hypothetical protein